MPETKEASPEVTSTIEELAKPQQDFAKLAIDALANHFDLEPTDFDVFKVDEEDSESEVISLEDIRKDGTPWIPATPQLPARHVIQFAGSKKDIKAQKKASKDFKKPNGSVSVGPQHWETRIYKSKSLADGSQGKKVPTVDIPYDI